MTRPDTNLQDSGPTSARISRFAKPPLSTWWPLGWPAFANGLAESLTRRRRVILGAVTLGGAGLGAVAGWMLRVGLSDTEAASTAALFVILGAFVGAVGCIMTWELRDGTKGVAPNAGRVSLDVQAVFEGTVDPADTAEETKHLVREAITLQRIHFPLTVLRGLIFFGGALLMFVPVTLAGYGGSLQFWIIGAFGVLQLPISLLGVKALAVTSTILDRLDQPRPSDA